MLLIPGSSSRSRTENWEVVDEMIARTDPGSPLGDLSLEHFGGRIEGSGRINLSTLHSAKGREFDVVVFFAMNADVLPSWRDRRNPMLRVKRAACSMSASHDPGSCCWYAIRKEIILPG
jgi:superfamily I DNA/RNA helicase